MNNVPCTRTDHHQAAAWARGLAPVAVVMISLNEAHNMEAVLQNLAGWAQEVFLVDSYSADHTVDIALRHGVHVVQRAFRGFGDQWNFALRELPITAPWTMKLDPDERLSDSLKREITARIRTGDADGYSMQRRLWFMGRPMPVRHKLVRGWRTGACHFSDVLVNEHPIIRGRIRRLHGTMEHHDSPDLGHWLDKQNRYSTAEAVARFNGDALAAPPRLFGTRLQRRMWVKQHFRQVPFRYELLFFYNYVLLGAWRAGWVGYAWARLRSDVYRYREYKLREIRLTGRLPVSVPRGAGAPDPRARQYAGAAEPKPLPRKDVRKPAGVRFHDQLASTWSEGYAREGFSRRLAFIERLLHDLVQPEARWLDAGCGSGVLTRRLAALGAAGDAVDGSAEMIREAQHMAAIGNPEARFAYRLIETIEHLDSPDQEYDGVLCSSVIEYVDSPSAALAELARVLKPGGTLVLSVANRHSLIRFVQRCARSLFARFGKDMFGYLDVSRTTHSRRQICAALSAHGIRIDTVLGFDPVLPRWLARAVPPALIFAIGTKPATGPTGTRFALQDLADSNAFAPSDHTAQGKGST
jgi:2-polyprenyl-3-methyl-5-hydroxy-6-metoxy-1,4-benzoquinol methylase/glycosyltransferase involved in cell wall biosynthesis